MKILHINSSDSSGGAARACLDINNALNKIGIDSCVLVQMKQSELEDVYSVNINFIEKIKTLARRSIDYLFIKLFSRQTRGRFTFPFFGKNISSIELVRNSDIINLHWVNEGFISLAALKQIAKLGKPIVWTFHDMWPFTGGCHYSLGCRKFEIECLDCPSLKYKGQNDLSNKIFRDKLKVFKDLNLSIITCSNWLSKEVKKSNLFKDKRTEVIPNTLKTEVYKPLDKPAIFKEFKLDENKKYILFGTMTLRDERKGIDLFLQSIQLLLKKDSLFQKNVQLLIAGSGKAMEKINLPLDSKFLGRINDESDMAKFYNTGTLFVAPSREDNLPNTVMESLSCGTPVVAFNIGGMPDMIDHKINGYLAKPFDVEDLADGIMWVLNNSDPERLVKASRAKILDNFTFVKIAESYSGYYQTILSQK